MEVYGELYVITGAWLQTIGASVTAIGNTIAASVNDDEEDEKVSSELYILGNAVEATGNSLQAIGQTRIQKSEDETIGIIGDWLQAAGNIANVVGGSTVLNGNVEEGLNVDIIGDVIQSIGAAFEAQSSSLRDSDYAALITSGQRIQSVSVAIEAIGLVYVKKGKDKLGEQLIAVGSYGQTAGAALSAIGLTKEYHQSRSLESWNNGYYYL
ncbi:DUF6944 family repetitive protein [Guptibacillus algicola]|uniref:DUF6944 family repetitive protein n=1 Tax=Guptibacillus algicola TaxID=225844 RepID=UPI001CD763C0|nr:hypothetical protein [Alkalihalobacillus algicola]MCA0987493.1 hypothetical protein [Alkalihalobacillus algicola]